jgi:hypothetical protein
MKPGTGLASHGFVGAVRITRLGLLQPVLHVQSRPGTFEDDISHEWGRIGKAARLDHDLDQGLRVVCGTGLLSPLAVPALPSVQRFRHDPDAENRPLGLVEQFHLPLGVLLELAGNSGRHLGTGAGQCFPRGIAIGTFRSLFGGAGKFAVSDTKKIERHRRLASWPPPTADSRRQVDAQRTATSIRGNTVRAACCSAGSICGDRLAWRAIAAANRGTHSLSVIRISPSPETTGPFAVSAT